MEGHILSSLRNPWEATLTRFQVMERVPHAPRPSRTASSDTHTFYSRVWARFPCMSTDRLRMVILHLIWEFYICCLLIAPKISVYCSDKFITCTLLLCWTVLVFLCLPPPLHLNSAQRKSAEDQQRVPLSAYPEAYQLALVWGENFPRLQREPFKKIRENDAWYSHRLRIVLFSTSQTRKTSQFTSIG